MGLRSAGEMVALDDALKSLTLGSGRHVDLLPLLKNGDRDL